MILLIEPRTISNPSTEVIKMKQINIFGDKTFDKMNTVTSTRIGYATHSLYAG